MSSLSVLILAAGKGVRMKSATPKVLHAVGGRPMVDVVLGIVSTLKPAQIGVIVGHQGPVVRGPILNPRSLSRRPVAYADIPAFKHFWMTTS
jgi:bifunctional UDP-N-acetylglucosamine pyrophosphorylase/glucosamine-1-phosphate N-acetyltransferase